MFDLEIKIVGINFDEFYSCLILYMDENHENLLFIFILKPNTMKVGIKVRVKILWIKFMSIIGWNFYTHFTLVLNTL